MASEELFQRRPNTTLQCLAPRDNPNRDYQVIGLQFERVEDIPPELEPFVPGEVLDRSRDGKVDFFFALPNDNKMMGLVAAAGRQDLDGDDFGKTHGMKVNVGKDYDGYYVATEYSTDLYTKRIPYSTVYYPDGNRKVSQYFTEENILKITVDNMHKGKAWFWRAGAGLHQLNSEKVGGWTSAAGQQNEWHSMLNGMHAGLAHIPDNVPNGKGIRDGALMTLALGVTDAMMLGGACRVTRSAEVEVRKSSLKDADLLKASAEANIYRQEYRNSYAFKAGARLEATSHEQGTETRAALVAEVGRDDWTFGMETSKKVRGMSPNYVDYNLDSDLTWTLYFTRKFGRSRRTPSKSWMTFSRIGAHADQAQ